MGAAGAHLRRGVARGRPGRPDGARVLRVRDFDDLRRKRRGRGRGWERPALDPIASARQAALLAARNEPEVVKLAAVEDDTAPLRDRALGVMRQRKQSVDPKSANFSEHYRLALLEVSK